MQLTMEIRERINPQESTAQLSQLPQGGKYCGVEQWITNDVMFVTCNKSVYCQHQLLFGDKCACTHKVRHEIYNRLGI